MKEIRINKFKIFMLLCWSVLIISSSTKAAYVQDINIALPPFDNINGLEIINSENMGS